MYIHGVFTKYHNCMKPAMTATCAKDDAMQDFMKPLTNKLINE